MSAVTNPTGAFLFTDIEGSTELWERDPVLMAEQLTAHDQFLIEAIVAHQGRQFKHLGDGVVAVYPTAADAISSALAMQTRFTEHQWPLNCQIGIRIGVHEGPYVQTESDYFGRTLNWTSRIMAAGNAGQIVVSTTALLSLSAQERAQCNTRYEGVHRLKGISEDVELWSLAPLHMAFVDRPLRTLDPLDRNTIPLSLSELIGREVELAQTMELLATNRLVSLIGPGGAGKTRLAMSAAQDAAQRFRARVHVVELAPINASDALGVASAIAHAALGPDALATPGTELDRVAALGSSALRPLLLVLDNCEHLITEAAHAITYLLAKAPGISVLVTSRQPLGLSGEAIVLVEPLAIESEHGSSNSSPAVQLFLQRARTAAPNHPEFDLDLVSKICRRLDGLPLAIELAAARVGVLSLHDLDARLFDVLRSSRRNTSQTVDARRHATIDAAVRWSYELLADDERLVLNRASVFASSFDLQAATKVCGGTEFSEVDVMEIVSSLVDRSMISSVYAEVGNRFRLLEMVREFVASQVPVEEYESLKLTHQQHYLRTTAPLALALDAKPDASIIASLVADDLNVFAAIRHRSTPVALNAARKLALQLHTFFEETGRVPRAYVEMRDLLEPREPHSRLWRSLLGTTVVYSVMTGRTEEMTNELEVLRELVADRSDSTSRNTATWAYLGLAFFELTQANMSAAVDWFETAGSVIGQFDTNGQRQWLMTCGACMAYDGRAVDALHFYDEARKLPGVPQGWFDDYADVFVRAAQVQRDPRQASDHIDSMIRSLTALSDLHLGFRTTVATLHACFALEEADRAEQLEVWWRVALDAAYRNGHLWGVGMALQLGAWSAARQHDDEIAATRFAVTDAAFVRSGFRLPKAFVAISNTYLAALQQRMGPAFAEVSTAARSFDPAAYAAQTNSHPR